MYYFGLIFSFLLDLLGGRSHPGSFPIERFQTFG